MHHDLILLNQWSFYLIEKNLGNDSFNEYHLFTGKTFYNNKFLKGVLRPISCIDINTHSGRKSKSYVKFI